jgi:hypothetical protein
MECTKANSGLQCPDESSGDSICPCSRLYIITGVPSFFKCLPWRIYMEKRFIKHPAAKLYPASMQVKAFEPASSRFLWKAESPDSICVITNGFRHHFLVPEPPRRNARLLYTSVKADNSFPDVFKRRRLLQYVKRSITGFRLYSGILQHVEYNGIHAPDFFHRVRYALSAFSLLFRCFFTAVLKCTRSHSGLTVSDSSI